MLARRTFASATTGTPIRPLTAQLVGNTGRPAILRAHITTISDRIKADHSELKDYYNKAVNAKDKDDQDKWGNQFRWELARHSVAEELVVYPAFEQYLGDEGKRMADSDRKEHHKIKEHLKSFQNMDASHPRFIDELKTIMSTLEKHIEEEEHSDLPKFEKALSSADLKDVSQNLAESFEKTKGFVPSRSHPSAGEDPTFEGFMGLLTAPIDRLADMFRKFPKVNKH